MKLPGICFVVAVGLLASPALSLASEGRVLLRIEDDGEFEVLHARAENSGTSTVLFGLIGYGIEEGTRSNKDKVREEAIAGHLTDTDCRAGFESALVDRLREKGFEPTVVTGKQKTDESFDWVLKIRILACGFKKTDTTAEELSTFHLSTYELESGTKKLSEDRVDLLLTGTQIGSWEQILSDTIVADEEYLSVKNKAGRRIANKLIYRR